MKAGTILYSLLIFPSITFSQDINYAKIAEAISSRVDTVPVRYFRLYGEACINIQILDKKNWTAIKTRHICEVDGRSFDTGFADIHFSNPKFSEKGLHIRMSITPLTPTGEQHKKCFIQIKRERISPITCKDSY